MHEFVVPKSIPKTLAICVQSSESFQQRLFQMIETNPNGLSYNELTRNSK